MTKIGNFIPRPASMNGPKIIKAAPPQGQVSIAEIGNFIAKRREREELERQAAESKEQTAGTLA